jgi:isoamylase
VEMTDQDWWRGTVCTIGMFVDGATIRARGTRGERLLDASYLTVLHAGENEVTFVLPAKPWASRYDVVLDTARESGVPGATRTHRAAGAGLRLTPYSLVLLRASR